MRLRNNAIVSTKPMVVAPAPTRMLAATKTKAATRMPSDRPTVTKLINAPAAAETNA